MSYVLLMSFLTLKQFKFCKICKNLKLLLYWRFTQNSSRKEVSVQRQTMFKIDITSSHVKHLHGVRRSRRIFSVKLSRDCKRLASLRCRLTGQKLQIMFIYNQASTKMTLQPASKIRTMFIKQPQAFKCFVYCSKLPRKL